MRLAAEKDGGSSDDVSMRVVSQHDNDGSADEDEDEAVHKVKYDVHPDSFQNLPPSKDNPGESSAG